MLGFIYGQPRLQGTIAKPPNSKAKAKAQPINELRAIDLSRDGAQPVNKVGERGAGNEEQADNESGKAENGNVIPLRLWTQKTNDAAIREDQPTRRNRERRKQYSFQMSPHDSKVIASGLLLAPGARRSTTCDSVRPPAPRMSTHVGRASKDRSFDGIILLSSKSMVVSDSIFDALVFGVLLLALLLDNVFPFSPLLHGAASLLAVGTAAYFAAQEMSEAMSRRGWWSQESLSTSLALSVMGFIYYFWRNGSDTALLALSIVLMMTALMILISLLTAFGEAWHHHSAHALAGLVATVSASLALGALSGLLVLLLSSSASLGTKAIIVAVGAVLWKLRETLRPPARNTPAQEEQNTPASPRTASQIAPDSNSNSKHSALVPRRALMPQRGTLLDRFLPVLVLSALLFVTLQQAGFSFK